MKSITEYLNLSNRTDESLLDIGGVDVQSAIEAIKAHNIFSGHNNKHLGITIEEDTLKIDGNQYYITFYYDKLMKILEDYKVEIHNIVMGDVLKINIFCDKPTVIRDMTIQSDASIFGMYVTNVKAFDNVTITPRKGARLALDAASGYGPCPTFNRFTVNAREFIYSPIELSYGEQTVGCTKGPTCFTLAIHSVKEISKILSAGWKKDNDIRYLDRKDMNVYNGITTFNKFINMTQSRRYIIDCDEYGLRKHYNTMVSVDQAFKVKPQKLLGVPDDWSIEFFNEKQTRRVEIKGPVMTVE